jgi:hypothetical protein
MKNLNENIQRIKQMMNTINEGSFDNPIEPEISLEVRQGITKVLNKFIQNPELYDYSVSAFDGEFMIEDEEGDETLTYEFDINYTSRSSYSSGVMYLPGGDPGYPPSWDFAEYKFDITRLTYSKFIEGSGNTVLYKDKDITNFLKVQLSNGMSGEEFMYDNFNDEIQEKESDIDYDDPDSDF